VPDQDTRATAGRSGRRALVVAAVTGTLSAPAVRAQAAFPNRAIRLLIPWAPGGTTDVVCRALAQAATRHLGQPVVIDNRPGAGGILAAQLMASGQVRPDGYTLHSSHIGLARIPFMRRGVGFDPVADFTYIIGLCGYVFGFVVRADKPWRTWADFVPYARAHPDQLTYGSSGVGSDGHVSMHELLAKEGLRLTHVPFRGIAEAVTALTAGQIDCVGDGSAWAPSVDSGDFRLLNIWTAERVPRFPDVPTLRELGYDMVRSSPYGIAGPKGMDPGVVKVLHDAFKAALHEPEHRAAMARFDLPLIYMDTAEYTAFMARQAAEERRIVQELGLRIE
jgi:tripartite-type tricarboxylate transporter receptor subunit TctC